MARNMRALLLVSTGEPHEALRGSLKEAFDEASVDAVSVSETLKGGAQWSNAISDAIQQADVIVADVSNTSPSVFYELGLARSLGKPMVILLSTEAKGALPPDLASYQIVTYDPANLNSLKSQMSRVLSYQVSKLTA
jgi:nucleoside 2-deoxyribosyltransferase